MNLSVKWKLKALKTFIKFKDTYSNLFKREMILPSKERIYCSAYETLLVTEPANGVIKISLNRPSKMNALNQQCWIDIRNIFHRLKTDDACRSVILTGHGNNFTSGLDIFDHIDLLFGDDIEKDTARKTSGYLSYIEDYQASITAIEKCPKPVIAAVQSACVGAGVDMICSSDIKLCSSDAWFCIKEVELGLAADVGTLQRLPKIVGNDSIIRELSYSSRRFGAKEAKKIGLVSRVCNDHTSLQDEALKIAKQIAEKSPVAVQGTKINLNYSRDHTVDESLNFMAVWNAAMLQTDDIPISGEAFITKQPPTYGDL